jgi:uncharacterized OB-fold protein
VADQPFRLLPRLHPRTEHFWTGGAEGELRILRCQDCGYWLHPPAPICPRCLTKNLAPEATSGRGVVHTFTINHQPWYPGLDPPYVVAIVELEDQEALRLTTNLVGIDPGGVEIGAPVQVVFEQYEDVWLPFFAPREDG